jgi:hypothetical protein
MVEGYVSLLVARGRRTGVKVLRARLFFLLGRRVRRGRRSKCANLREHGRTWRIWSETPVPDVMQYL